MTTTTEVRLHIVIAILEDALRRLSRPGVWARGGCSTARGNLCLLDATSVASIALCASSAEESEADNTIREAVGGMIAQWNDAPGRTQSEVCAALVSAIKLAREKYGVSV